MIDERLSIVVNYLKTNNRKQYQNLHKILSDCLTKIERELKKESKNSDDTVVLEQNKRLKESFSIFMDDYNFEQLNKSEECLSLSDDWENVSPYKISVENNTYLATSWAIILQSFCFYLYENDAESFLNALRNIDDESEARQNITFNPPKTKQFIYDKIINIYILKKIQPNTTKNIIIQLLNAMNLMDMFLKIKLHTRNHNTKITNENTLKRYVKELEHGAFYIQPISRKSCPECKKPLNKKRLLYKKNDNVCPLYVQTCKKCNTYYINKNIYDAFLLEGTNINELTFLDTSQFIE